MSAEVDFLVGGSSPTTFSSNYSFKSKSCNHNDPKDISNSKTLESSFESRKITLDFPIVLSSRPKSSSYLNPNPWVFESSPPTHSTVYGKCSSRSLRPVPLAKITLNKEFDDFRLNLSHSSQMPVAETRRSCLVVRCDVLGLSNPSRSKKKVVFADDRGFPLTIVRTMTEPSNMPPQWSLQFIAQITQGAKAEPVSEPWEVAFPQPASDYLAFRRRLDDNNVTLENVIVKENEQLIFGTVKVRNLEFEKQVFVRTTADNWKTQEDIMCTYVSNGSLAQGVTVMYDTFSFRLSLPPSSRKVEFCICFRCSGAEYWDNNLEKNYFIIKKHCPLQTKQGIQMGNNDSMSDKKKNLSWKFRDDVKSNTRSQSLSKFAERNLWEKVLPYW